MKIFFDVVGCIVAQRSTMKHATMKRKPSASVLRARCPQKMKTRVSRLAAARHCDESDVIREALANHLDAEELRLGLRASQAA